MKKLMGILMLGLLLVGCTTAKASNQPREVTVTVKEFTVEMSATSVPANTPVKFTVTNKGKIEHEVIIEKVGDVDKALEDVGEDGEVEHIQPGETRSVTWTIKEPGDYQLACHTPGHFEAGMLQKLSVVASK